MTRIGAGAVAGRIVLLWYGIGAAHPNRSLGTVVIATTTATPITVDDLYRGRSAALDRLRSLLPELDATKRVATADVTGTDFADAWLPTSAGLEVYVPVAHVAGDYAPSWCHGRASPINSVPACSSDCAPTDRPPEPSSHRRQDQMQQHAQADS